MVRMKCDLIKRILAKERVQDYTVKQGNAVIVMIKDEYFFVSESTILGRFETLAFKCDKKSKIENFTEVAGGIGKNITETIKEIKLNKS